MFANENNCARMCYFSNFSNKFSPRSLTNPFIRVELLGVGFRPQNHPKCGTFNCNSRKNTSDESTRKTITKFSYYFEGHAPHQSAAIEAPFIRFLQSSLFTFTHSSPYIFITRFGFRVSVPSEKRLANFNFDFL